MLQITKEKVLEAASKCSTAEATLKVLFPEVFKDDFPETEEIMITTFSSNNEYGIFIGNEFPPPSLKRKCLMVNKDSCLIVPYNGYYLIVPKELEHHITPDMKRLS